MDIRIEYAIKVKKAIENVFNTRYYTIDICNYGSAIRVLSKSSGATNIWIRLESWGNNYIVNVSSIELAKHIRRKGYFTAMMKSIASLNFVTGLKVGGVSTKQMLAWCNKYGFINSDGLGDFNLTNKEILFGRYNK